MSYWVYVTLSCHNWKRNDFRYSGAYLFTSFVYRTNVYRSVIHGIKRKPHLSLVWNWYHFVAIASYGLGWYKYAIATQWYQFHTTDAWWFSLNTIWCDMIQDMMKDTHYTIWHDLWWYLYGLMIYQYNIWFVSFITLKVYVCSSLYMIKYVFIIYYMMVFIDIFYDLRILICFISTSTIIPSSFKKLSVFPFLTDVVLIQSNIIIKHNKALCSTPLQMKFGLTFQ